MSLLNITNDGLPNILVLLHATVLRARRPLSKKELLDTVAPDAYVTDGGDMARQTLNSWIQVGLFREEGETIVTDTFPGTASTASLIDLVAFTRSRACRAAMSEAANPDLWGTQGASDLVRSLAWLMTQDAYQITSFGEMDSQEATQAMDRVLTRNKTRTSGMPFWAPFLGFSREKFGLIDPTVALRGALPDIMEVGDRLTADDFLDRVAAALPVLDRGRWQKAVAENMDPQPQYLLNAGQVSTALSRALLNLRATGELSLQRSSDTKSSMVLSGAQGARNDMTFQEVLRGGRA